MQNNICLYFGKRIREERNKQHLSLTQLAQVCYMDKGYLSKIETGVLIISVEFLANIYLKLGIKLIYEASQLSIMAEKLEVLTKHLIMLDAMVIEKEIISINAMEKEYLNSELFIKYELVNALYFCEVREDLNKVKTIIDYLKRESIRYDYLNNRDKQEYDYLWGSYYYKKKQIDKAIDKLKDSIDIGYKSILYGLVNDKLSAALAYKGDYMEAYYYENLAVNEYACSMNAKRQLRFIICIAELFSKNKEYKVAEKIYVGLIKNNPERKMLVDKYIIENYVRAERYQEAYALINKDMICKVDPGNDYVLICLYRLNRINELKKSLANYTSHGKEDIVYRIISILI